MNGSALLSQNSNRFSLLIQGCSKTLLHMQI